MTYTTVSSYDGISPLHRLEKLIDSLETGRIYRIRMRARNQIGWGMFSSDLLAAMTAIPKTPSVPI